MMEFLLTKTPLVFLTQNFWRDEAFSFLMASQSIGQIILSTARDFSPPLYYLVLHIWMKIFGSSEIALRSISLMFFYATIYIVDHILVEVMKIRSRWRYLYLLLIAVNPFLIYYAAEARMYTMSAFLVTLSWYAFLTGKKKLHIVSSALALYTHYFTVLALAGQFLFAYIRKHHRPRLKVFTSIGLLFAPWIVFTFFFHGSSDDSFWIMQPSLRTVEYLPGIILTGFEQSFRLYSTPLTALTLITYGAILLTLKNIYRLHEKKELTMVLLLWIFTAPLVALIISLIKPVFLPRYFIFSVVGMNLLLIYSLDQLKPMVRGVVLVVLIVFLTQYNLIQVTHRSKGDIKSVIQEIKKNILPGDVVYVDTELNFHTVQYYFDPHRVFIYRKTYQEIPQYVGKVLINQNQVVSTLPIFPKKAYIIHDDLSYDIQSMN